MYSIFQRLSKKVNGKYTIWINNYYLAKDVKEKNTEFQTRQNDPRNRSERQKQPKARNETAQNGIHSRSCENEKTTLVS